MAMGIPVTFDLYIDGRKLIRGGENCFRVLNCISTVFRVGAWSGFRICILYGSITCICSSLLNNFKGDLIRILGMLYMNIVRVREGDDNVDHFPLGKRFLLAGRTSRGSMLCSMLVLRR